MKHVASTWRKSVAGLRSDERGAESSEVILVLVLLVIGLFAAWNFLRDRIDGQARQTGTCIDNPTAANCQ